MKTQVEQDFNLDDMDALIQRLRSTAETLRQMGENFPAIAKNTDRILASVKMLELNISDVVSLERTD